METSHRGGAGRRGLLLLGVAGAGLLVAAAAIHLDLYLTGYRSIPTIGWLFLLQVIVAFLLAALVLAAFLPGVPRAGRWLATAAGAVFAVATLGGYLLSVWTGLFGFREVSTTAGIAAAVIEVAAFAALAGAALIAARQQGVLARLPAGLASRRAAVPAVAGLSAVALILLGVALAGAGGTAQPASAAGGGNVVKSASVGGQRVLTNAKGFTLYWFAPDPKNKSVCNGSCSAYWPPVPGPVTAGAGVTGQLGSITRADGTKQATYQGHALYTYVGDSAPGQARGNNINLNGGLWVEVPASG